MKNSKLSLMVLAALFIAFSFVGGTIKIMGTIAFDSMPAFLGSLVLGPVYGAVIGALGHIFDAAMTGFPLTLPVHLIIMVFMAVVVYVFSKIQLSLQKRISPTLSVLAALIVAALLNGPVECFLLAPIMGMAAIIPIIPVLTLASLANIFLAQLIYAALPRWIKNYVRG